MNSGPLTSEKHLPVNNLEERYTPLDPAAVTALADRILASAGFRKSARLRDLLGYLVEQWLLHPDHEVTETRIGLEVFSRRSFHPNEDSIVRVTTRQLRARLEEYFHADGASEPWILEIPRGSYTPLLHPRTPDHTPLPRWWRNGYTFAALGAVALLALAAAAALHLQIRQLRAAALPPLTLVRQLLLAPNQRTVLVAADSGYFLLQKMLGRSGSLSEYLNRGLQAEALQSQRDPHLAALAVHLGKAAHTGIAELSVFARILQQNPHTPKLEVRHAREMALRDFKQDNHLILGSPLANPWCELFEAKTSFRIEYDPEYHNAVIRNLHPQPGEPATWGSGGREQFAVIAVLPNLAGTGRVLLADATAMSSKEAAGDFITDPSVPALLARRFGVPDLLALDSFQVVLKSHSVDGAARGWEILAARPR